MHSLRALSNKEYTVTFDAGEGALYDAAANSSVTVSKNAALPRIPGANRDGYSLEGWYTEQNGAGTKLTKDTKITADTAFYANWVTAQSLFESSSDGLYDYTVKWLTNSNEYATNVGDNLIVAPSNGNSALSVTLYVQFDFKLAGSGGSTLPANSVQIKIPKHVFKNAQAKV